MSAQNDTVYRDKRGRKLDMLNEFMNQQSNTEGKKKMVEQAQFEWGKGSVQKKELEESKKEFLEIASEPFARSIDNPRIDKIRKETLRDGDPMAEYFLKKKERQAALEEENDQSHDDRYTAQEDVNNINRKGKRKPLYKGPIPTPNRFGIMPGYRWDAVDRGNKFEHRVMTKINNKNSLKEDAYKWSVSDL